MNKKLIITGYNDGILSLLYDNNKETRLEYYDNQSEINIGDIVIGRVKDIVKNINAAFVEVMPGRVCYFSILENKHPFFVNAKNTDKLCQGDLVLVQIKKDGTATKAPTCSCDISISGKFCAISVNQAGMVGVSRKIEDKNKALELKDFYKKLVNDDFGIVVRTDAANATEEELLKDYNEVKEQFYSIYERARHKTAFTKIREADIEIIRDVLSYKLDDNDEIVTDIPEIANILGEKCRIYNDEYSLIKLYNISKVIDDVTKPHVWLKSGGYLIIQPTEALTVIDVNSGKFDGNQRERDKTFLKIDLEACDEIARQLILRNISGIIIIDFINLHNESDRQVVLEHMKKLLIHDPVSASFVDFTKLDLMEITRKKTKKPLYERIKKND